jgi:hypothetical protein
MPRKEVKGLALQPKKKPLDGEKRQAAVPTYVDTRDITTFAPTTRCPPRGEGR